MKAADAANSFLVLSSGGRRAAPPRPFFLLRIWVAAALGALVIWNHSQRVEPASQWGPGLPCLRISRAREAEPSAAAAGWRRSYGVEVDDRLIAPA